MTAATVSSALEVGVLDHPHLFERYTCVDLIDLDSEVVRDSLNLRAVLKVSVGSAKRERG